MSSDPSVLSKSFHAADAKIQYCVEHSLRMDPVQDELSAKTLAEAPDGGMLGAPEVLQFGANFIRLIKAKRVLDVGTFTGASAFAWALAVPADGEVLTMDVSHECLDKYGRGIMEKKPDVIKKIKFFKGPALEKLDSLIAAGESGKWDFAFIDADKPNYQKYYERCVTLLRSGGVIIIDNALWGGRVTDPVQVAEHESSRVIDATNKAVHKDQRVCNMLLTTGDGANVIFKK